MKRLAIIAALIVFLGGINTATAIILDYNENTTQKIIAEKNKAENNGKYPSITVMGKDAEKAKKEIEEKISDSQVVAIKGNGETAVMYFFLERGKEELQIKEEKPSIEIQEKNGLMAFYSGVVLIVIFLFALAGYLLKKKVIKIIASVNEQKERRKKEKITKTAWLYFPIDMRGTKQIGIQIEEMNRFIWRVLFDEKREFQLCSVDPYDIRECLEKLIHLPVVIDNEFMANSGRLVFNKEPATENLTEIIINENRRDDSDVVIRRLFPQYEGKKYGETGEIQVKVEKLKGEVWRVRFNRKRSFEMKSRKIEDVVDSLDSLLYIDSILKELVAEGVLKFSNPEKKELLLGVPPEHDKKADTGFSAIDQQEVVDLLTNGSVDIDLSKFALDEREEKIDKGGKTNENS